MNASLRPVDRFDAPVLAALQAACFPEEPWTARSLAESLAMPGAYGTLAEDDGGPAGPVPAGFVLARAAGGEAEILSLAVAPAVRRRGVGRDLLQAALEGARMRRAGRMVLEVAADNATARALYASAGFVEAGRRAEYYDRCDGPSIDALILVRALSTGAAGEPWDSHDSP